MKFVWLATICLSTWIVLTVCTDFVTNQSHWIFSSIGCAICLIPALGTMAVVGMMEERSPVEALGSVLVAPLVRLVAVAILGAVAFAVVTEIKAFPVRFLAWICVFYLLTLVVETALLLRKKRSLASPVSTDSPRT